MTKQLMLVVAISAWATVVQACTEEFSTCHETHTCPRPSGAGDGGEGDVMTPGSSGASPNPSGGTGETGETGGDQNGGENGDGTAGGGGGVLGLAGERNDVGGAIGSAGGDGNSPTDVTQPTLVSASPANGAKGIESGAAVVITFSEAVQRSTAEAAFTSDIGQVVFSWNALGTQLTATPTETLTYATGTGLSLKATTYTYTIANTVEDLFGNRLTSPTSATFSTLRKITASITKPVGNAYILSNWGGEEQMYLADQPMGGTIGDDEDNSYKRTVIDFDISALPAGITRVVTAAISVEISLEDPTGVLQWGNPFATLGPLRVEHIYDSPIELSTLTVAPLAAVGVLMSTVNPTPGVKTLDVTDAVVDDVKNRGSRASRSQYRVQFNAKTDDDGNIDLVSIRPDTNVKLAVEYLIP